jgi:hypothetical protein
MSLGTYLKKKEVKWFSKRFLTFVSCILWLCYVCDIHAVKWVFVCTRSCECSVVTSVDVKCVFVCTRSCECFVTSMGVKCVFVCTWLCECFVTSVGVKCVFVCTRSCECSVYAEAKNRHLPQESWERTISSTNWEESERKKERTVRRVPAPKLSSESYHALFSGIEEEWTCACNWPWISHTHKQSMTMPPRHLSWCNLNKHLTYLRSIPTWC